MSIFFLNKNIIFHSALYSLMSGIISVKIICLHCVFYKLTSTSSNVNMAITGGDGAQWNSRSCALHCWASLSSILGPDPDPPASFFVT